MIAYDNTTELDIDIPLMDGHKVHAKLRGRLDDKNPIVIMMHGRPGTGNELLQYLGARYLSQQGITTLRLWMYDYGQSYRSIINCSLDTHISDFETAVDYVSSKSQGKVFALGHSYGGLTILGSKARLDGAVLWDPTHGMAWHDSNFDSLDYPEKTYDNLVVGLGGSGYLYPVRQGEQDKLLGDNTSWAANKGYPTKYILAAAGPLARYAKKYFEVADDPKELVEITGAHHQFEDSDAITEQLFAETAEFIKKYN